jgi:hypothetical protein
MQIQPQGKRSAAAGGVSIRGMTTYEAYIADLGTLPFSFRYDGWDGLHRLPRITGAELAAEPTVTHEQPISAAVIFFRPV